MSFEGINNLNDLDVGFPLDGASTADLARELRHTKALLKNVLLQSHRPSGTLKGITIDSLASGSVGSDQLVDGAVITSKLADEAVMASKLAPNSVTNTKIADGAVVQGKLGPNAILPENFADGSLPLRAIGTPLKDEQISSSETTDSLRAIGKNHLKDGAVTDRAVSTVGVTKLRGGSVGQLLVATASGWVPVTPTGGLIYDPVGNTFQVASQVSAAAIADVKNRGTNGGASIGGSWMDRDIGELLDPDGIISFVGNAFKLLDGDYFFFARCPAAGDVGKHQARLLRTDASAVSDVVLWGSSEQCAAGMSGSSVIQGAFTADATHTYRIQHFFQNSDANGLGVAASSDNSVVYPNGNVEIYTSGYLFKI